jgi:hypothetical protein
MADSKSANTCTLRLSDFGFGISNFEFRNGVSQFALRQPFNDDQALDLAEFRISGEQDGVHLLRQRHRKGIGVGKWMLGLDVRGSKGQLPIRLDDTEM